MKIAKITVNLPKSKLYRESLCAWLHEKAEEIKNLDDNKYIEKPSWSFYDDGTED